MSAYIQPPAGVNPDAWDAALAAVRGYCGWYVAPEVTEDVKVEALAGLILLPSLKVSAVNSVTDEDGKPIASGWRLRRRGALRGPWRDREEYTVNIRHGYERLPAEVQAVARDLASTAGSMVGATSMSAGPFQISKSPTAASVQAGVVGLSDLQKQVLDAHRVNFRP